MPDQFLDVAIDEAGLGLAEGGIPIGSVIVLDGEIVVRGHNRRVQKGSPILHGEMDALENAGRLVPSEYRRSTIYTTLSPCPMCTGAILLYEIPQVVIGENRTFLGAEDTGGIGTTMPSRAGAMCAAGGTSSGALSTTAISSSASAMGEVDSGTD